MGKFLKLSSLFCAVLFAASSAYADDFVWKHISAGDATSYGVRNDGTLWAWGWNEKGQAANGIKERSAVPTLTNASMKWRKVVAGKAYAFFLGEDGSLWAAGTSESGVQGTGDGVDHKVLTRIGTDSDWVDVACTRFWGYSAFGIKKDGTLWAWGENSSGQLGIDNMQTQIVPVQVGKDSDWKQIAMGTSTALAVKTDGSLWGWGGNMRGEVFGYTGRQTTPVRLGNGTDWDFVCVIEYRAYGVKKDGTLWAWGDNERNLLGLNSPLGEDGYVIDKKIVEPTQVKVITGKVLEMSGCENTLSVVTGDQNIIDKIWMFGSNGDGALGDGKGLGNGNKDIPFAVIPVTPALKSSLRFSHVVSGQNYSLALTTDGDIWGWGCNRGGQLGDETPYDQLQTAYKLKPILINCPQDVVTNVQNTVAAGHQVAFNGQMLSFAGSDKLTSAVVYNMQGSAVMILSASASQWSVSSLAKGIYVACFTMDNGQTLVYKFTK